MKKYLFLFLHIGFWLCYLFLALIIIAVYNGGEDNISSERFLHTLQLIIFLALIPSFVTFYGYYHFVFRQYIIKKKYAQSICFSLLISLTTGFLGYVLLYFFLDTYCEKGSTMSSFVGITFFSTVISTITGIVALLMQGFITWIDEINMKEELSLKNNEIELALVKSQLDPHFLFNTINNIDVLISKNATAASNYLNKLSEIMRFMLYETKTEKIFLAKELLYIEKYIELQKIRTSNASFISFSVIGKSNNFLIPPMIFIPFIENAFKYATNKKIRNAISISLMISKDTITFVCINQFNPDAKKESANNGLGNQLIKKRLDLIYERSYKLNVSIVVDLYSVTLTIPTHA